MANFLFIIGIYFLGLAAVIRAFRERRFFLCGTGAFLLLALGASIWAGGAA